MFSNFDIRLEPREFDIAGVVSYKVFMRRSIVPEIQELYIGDVYRVSNFGELRWSVSKNNASKSYTKLANAVKHILTSQQKDKWALVERYDDIGQFFEIYVYPTNRPIPTSRISTIRPVLTTISTEGENTIYECPATPDLYYTDLIGVVYACLLGLGYNPSKPQEIEDIEE